MRRGLWFTTAVIVISAGYGFVAYERPLPVLASQLSKSAGTKGVAAVSLAWPTTGEAAIGAAQYGVLAMHGPQKSVPTASVAKIMTALAVLRVKPLALGNSGPTLTLTQADIANYNSYVAEGGSVAKVTLGEKITEYQALQALLLPSADNIADTLAVWAFGSIQAYSAYANSLAARLGMSDSHFGSVDASGYSPQTVSTAHDLVLLGEAALKNPVIARIVAEKSAIVPVAGAVQNVNWLLGQNGIDGIKTGNTDQAGGVYLFSAKQTFANGQTVTIVGAIMAEPTLEQALDDAVPLLSSAESHFSLTALVKTDQTMGSYDIPWLGTVRAGAAKQLSAVVWQGQDISPHITLKPLHVPVVAGAKVGTATFSVNPAPVPIVVTQTVNAPGWYWRLLHAF